MEYSFNNMTNKLNKNNFNFKKKFGQNFIVDKNTITNIVDKSQVDKEVLVIEVGPGAGSLTYELAKKAGQVIAFEIDETLKEILSSNLKEFDNVEIIYEDFLTVDVQKYLNQYNYKKIYLIANLPYYITTPIVTKVIESKLSVDKICIMVQKEVGDRFNATVRTKSYNSLTVYLNYYFNIKKLMTVSKNIFIPKPKVDSVVVEMVRKDEKLKLINEELFFKLVKDSFKQKRKTIKNNLNNYDLNKIKEYLEKNNYSLTSRAEELPLEIYVGLANEISK